VYYTVHYIQPGPAARAPACCAGARLLRWPLARLIPLLRLALLPLLATLAHHRRCPARRAPRCAPRCAFSSKSLGRALIFNGQLCWRPVPPWPLPPGPRQREALSQLRGRQSCQCRWSSGHRWCQLHLWSCLLTCKRVSWLAWTRCTRILAPWRDAPSISCY